ncbi:response regulator [Actinokineospora sp. G85]|uniref:response regulator n=1 Tax=Actinokineospora sp. G85 TaxID=3406626 RepID=UPI003C73890D
MTGVRVVLADDEPLVRAGIRAVLDAAGGVEVVAEGATGREAVDLVLAHRPRVAVLDIRMPDLSGLDATTELRRVAPDTAVLILTTFADDAHISRALTAGAAGFVLKTGDPHDILRGIHAVAAGAAYLSPTVAKRVVDHLTGGPRLRTTDRTAALTPREREVLGLLGAGLSNAEIARALHVVEGTVKVYLTTIFKRLNVRNRVEAAILAHEADLIPERPP